MAETSKRVTKMCCVPQCDNKWSSELSFHLFPKDVKLRKSWEVALRMGKPASDSMRVCSAHFRKEDFFPGVSEKQVRRLKMNTVPTQKIPVRPHDKDQGEKVQARRQEREARSAKRARPANEIADSQEITGDIRCETESENTGSSSQDVVPSVQKPSSVDSSCQTDSHVPCQCQNEKLKQKISLVDLLGSVEKLKNFTGLYSFELLETLVECVNDLLPPKQLKELPLKSRIILTFTKLKLNLKFTSLATLFGVSRTTCSSYFKETIAMLRVVLEIMVPWPEHETIRMNLPVAFKNYRNTRIVLDCAETPIERSKCLRCRILTWSNYKGKQTAKFDVGVTPSGLITHISQSYGGRASDKLIVNHSGVLDKLIFQDAVMTDKGFKIEEECLRRNLILHRPPFVIKKRQMSRHDAPHCAEIARPRVHVERVIQRIREFDFMCDPVPWELLPYFDDILVIVCGMVNLGPPVINIDKFM